ncbi:hypothetical protein [Mycobacterium sp. 1274761.0]|uniref:DUF6197 family protein n=1 Tax=Mycobacterium sp. 1274761.0 TaxID=1834077 RepID=UPI0007FD2D6A|nr:hypothetical protein [Mycobacterium sp. 1274761.0]OBK76296.1 hypothetical protein A5651_06735 [Mycobacterium sp. 1274761.0]
MADMNTDREVIEGALALIEADGGWTQGAYCRDADGTQVHPAVDSPGEWVRMLTAHVGAGAYRVRTEPVASPCSFCLGGALRTAAGYWHSGQPYAAQRQVDRLELLLVRLANSAESSNWANLDAFNDDVHTTAADAVLILKRAAAYLDAQGREGA